MKEIQKEERRGAARRSVGRWVGRRGKLHAVRLHLVTWFSPLKSS